METSVGTIEVVVLEELMSHEAQCQAHHTETNTLCSVEVTHRLKIECRGPDYRLVCQSAAEYVYAAHRKLTLCGGCETWADEEHWNIHPI